MSIAVSSPPRRRSTRLLPGFRLSLGFTVIYLSLIVLIPLTALILRPWELGVAGVWGVVTSPRVVAALKLSFGASAIAAAINAVMGLIVAWVLVRMQFPGRRLLDAIIDLPFALPTAVAGIALTALYAPNGPIGLWLAEFGIRAAYSPLGVVIALTFVGFPFVVRAVQPVLEDLDAGLEEAAFTLGANSWQRTWMVVLPAIRPALITGVSLAFARAVGEYGSVIFIAGNLPLRTEIAPLLIVVRLEEYDYAGAAAVGLAMLSLSFLILLAVNGLQRLMATPGAGR
ncbi:sulfate ABC transporter permease subunit CysT [Phenylobacterium sp.]|uniref:sulfate ABC transporter permease subunit CysT n=1 Tax=Phenylobacterium sp. TaxID=1871053 RepID=UPI002731AFB8|nr:sulfate ABC transporter permease subunit CysT [Phenylobacterium sp.]MDP1618114.1 sulfate ABC transporter permease subunit CysT [Phenylobacterium sp.]MDP1986467.1 sulfate ABC transporter permease subunit CysT [Phenylobacterium sp.]